MSFKDTQHQYKKLLQDITQGQFASVYLLMGEEAYFIDKLEHAIVENALSESERDFNLTIAYGKDSSAGDISINARRYPMMAERQVIVVREAQALARLGDLDTYMENPTPTTIVVLAHKTKNLDKRSALYKKIAKNGVVFESLSPRSYELDGYITDYLKIQNLKADAKAVSMLGEAVGANLSKLDSEVQKVVGIMGEGERLLTAEMVERYVGLSREYNVFELSKSLTERNFARALKICDHFAQNPRSNPFVVVCGVLFGHFQRLLIVSLMGWDAKKRGTRMPTDPEYAKALGVSPYVVREYTAGARVYTTKSLFAIMGHLRTYDLKSKGVGAGAGTSEGELLRELVLQISLS